MKRIYNDLHVLKFINAYIRSNGYSPSVREIRDGVPMGSTCTANNYLILLTQQGDITRVADRARTIAITPQGSDRLTN